MSKNIEKKIIDTAEDLFDVESGTVTRESGPSEIEDWDSIGHVRLMLAIEDDFNIKIPIGAAMSFNTIGAIADYVRDIIDQIDN